jgi:hypothetical protein
MRKIAALAMLALVPLAACSGGSASSSSSTANAAAVASANAVASAAASVQAACSASGGEWFPTGNGTCVTSSPLPTDPNGQSCTTLDSSGYCPGDDPVTMTKQTDTVVFKVEGSGYPSIQYGTDSINDQASGGYGPLGDGNALPWTASLPYNPSALYYAVSAQLEGSGSISDSVTEVITTYCSNGHHKTESFPLANGSASGGYTIAQAEYSSLGSGTGNASQAESDAGC